jgi:hypothetical protein
MGLYLRFGYRVRKKYTLADPRPMVTCICLVGME